MIFEKILTFVTGRVNQELLLKNEYLAEQLFPYPSHSNSSDKVILTTNKGKIRKKSRLGGLLNYYYCQAPA